MWKCSNPFSQLIRLTILAMNVIRIFAWINILTNRDHSQFLFRSKPISAFHHFWRTKTSTNNDNNITFINISSMTNVVYKSPISIKAFCYVPLYKMKTFRLFIWNFIPNYLVRKLPQFRFDSKLSHENALSKI